MGLENQWVIKIHTVLIKLVFKETTQKESLIYYEVQDRRHQILEEIKLKPEQMQFLEILDLTFNFCSSSKSK